MELAAVDDAKGTSTSDFASSTEHSPCHGVARPAEKVTMKIAQIAPLMESVPPRLYGGTERVVSHLTEELVGLGHDVTLFASGDSITSAALVSCATVALRIDPNVIDPIPYYMLMLDRVRRQAGGFDILHFHIDYLHFPLFRYLAGRTVTTLHGRQDLPDIKPIFLGFDDMPLVSISGAQRSPVANANFAATIHHGLPLNLMRPNFKPRGGYLAFIGRISPEKQPDRAIAIARNLGIPLRIAAKIDRVDEAYFKEKIAPLIDGDRVQFIGEINEQNKSAFLGEAIGLLFPIDWPEPFGLVMIEAMACGTPVLAFRCGSVPEIVDEGVSGMIVETIEEAIAAVPRLLAMDRRAVRKQFELRFSSARMARDYVHLYRRMLRGIGADTTETKITNSPPINTIEVEAMN